MLEEALRNPTTTQSPEMIVNNMLSFIQQDLLPTNGSNGNAISSEQRFFNLYSPLLERIFGTISIIINNNNNNNNNENNIVVNEIIKTNDICRHKEGGWLSTEIPFRSMSRTSSINNGNNTPRSRTSSAIINLDSDPIVKLIGGSLPTTSNPLPAHSSSPRKTNNNNNTFDNNNRDSLLVPTLIEAISKESQIRPNVLYTFPLQGLPKPLQDSLLQLIVIAMSGNNNSEQQQQHQIHQNQSNIYITENDIRLMTRLLRKLPLDQHELINHIQRKAENSSIIIRNQNEYTTVTSPRLPFHTISPSNNTTQLRSIIDMKQPIITEEIERCPNIMLDMFEYYLFIFIRFPLACPPSLAALTRQGSTNNVRSNNNNTVGVNTHRISLQSPTNANRQESYGETLYYHIFRRYLRLFLPYDSSSSSSVSLGLPDSNVRSISFTNKIDGISLSASSSLRESELFLRIIISFWLESFIRILPTETMIRSINERRMRASGLNYNNNNNNNTNSIIDFDLDLDSSFDLIQKHNLYEYKTPPMQVQRCLRLLIVHTILDPMVKSLVVEASNSNNNTRQESNTDTTRLINHRSTSSVDWCLTACMTALQLPLYNYIRATFRYATIHETNSSFYNAFNMWLIWLEPWNVVQVKRYAQNNATSRIIGTVAGDRRNFVVSRNFTVPRDKDPSLFDKESSIWEPYVAANLYMYVIPLAIFLRRARELDFSAGNFDRSMLIVKRVFRVFSPSLLHVLSKYLDKQNHQQQLHQLVINHEKNLGPHGPPQYSKYSMVSYKCDIQSLLEEIDIQHVKKVRELNAIDRLVGWIEGWFGKGVVSGEEKMFDSLIERAKLIANLPIDYDILPRSSSIRQSSTSTVRDTPKYRNLDGTLTDYGREQLLIGAWKCEQDDIVMIGDPMRIKVQNHEIDLLVTITVFLSDYLNKRFNLQQKKNNDGKIIGFRINLRFFADYRNLIFFIIMIYLFTPRKT